MSDTLNDLRDWLGRATKEYRKGEEVEVRDGAVHIYGMPPVPEGQIAAVDVHFVVVGFTEALPEWDADRLHAALLANPDGDFARLDRDGWEGGPSYITVGAWVGSQDLALRLFAAGQALGLWQVVTPGGLGIEGAQADQMAGRGFVMCTGLPRADAPSEVPG